MRFDSELFEKYMKDGSSYTLLNSFLSQIIKSKYNEIKLKKDLIKSDLLTNEEKSDILGYIYNCKDLADRIPNNFYNQSYNDAFHNGSYDLILNFEIVRENSFKLPISLTLEDLINNQKKFKKELVDAITKMDENTAEILRKQNEKKEIKRLKKFDIKHQPIIDELFNKSISFFENKDYKNTMICLSKALDIDPTQRLNKNLYFKRSGVKFELGDYYGCIKDIDSAIKLKSNDLKDCYYKKGLANFELKHFKEAINNFDDVTKLDTYNSESYYYKGLCKINLEDKENGCLDLSRAGELGYFEAYEQIKKNCNKDDKSSK